MSEKLEMRELNGQDTFLMTPIIAKLNIDDVIKVIREERSKYEDAELSETEIEDLGIEVAVKAMSAVLGNIDKVQKDLNRLLAKVCDTTIKEIESLGFADYNMLIIELFKQDEFKDFFKRLYSSFK